MMVTWHSLSLVCSLIWLSSVVSRLTCAGCDNDGPVSASSRRQDELVV